MPGTALRMALTFFCIYQGFVLFRAPTFAIARAMLHRLWSPPDGLASRTPTATACSGSSWPASSCVMWPPCRRWWDRLSLRLPTPVLGFTYVLALILCMVMAPLLDKPFIYFQF